MRGDVPEKLFRGRDEQAVLGEVGGDGVECEETEAHGEGCRFHEKPHGHHCRKEGKRGEQGDDAGGAVRDAPLVETLVSVSEGDVDIGKRDGRRRTCAGSRRSWRDPRVGS